MLEGSGALEIEGETVQLEEGQAVFVPAGAEHRFVGYEHLSVLVIFRTAQRARQLSGMDAPGAVTVFVAALATALATGLGAAPFLLVARLARSWVGLANALAAGFMIAASAPLMVTAQVVPDALNTSSRRSVALALGASTGVMLALEALLLA